MENWIAITGHVEIKLNIQYSTSNKTLVNRLVTKYRFAPNQSGLLIMCELRAKFKPIQAKTNILICLNDLKIYGAIENIKSDDNKNL